MDVLQLADVDEILTLDHHGEQLEEAGNVALLGIEGEVVPPAGEVDFALEDEPFEAVVLEAVHEYLLVDPEPFVIEQENAPECVYDLALLVIIMDEHLLVVLQDIVGYKLLLIELDAGLEGTINDLADECGIADEHLIVEADMVEEIGSAHSPLEVRQDVGHVLHQLLLALQVVEAQQCQVLVDGEQDLPVYLGERVVSDELDVGHEGNVDALCDVDSLEEFVVALLFIEVIVYRVLAEHALLNKH